MIFHEQYMQRFGCLVTQTMIQADMRGFLRQGVQSDLKRCSETSAAAFCLNFAMMQVDETFGNSQSKSKPAELAGYRRISLLEWLE